MNRESCRANLAPIFVALLAIVSVSLFGLSIAPL
jgi:hypothetical protein